MRIVWLAVVFACAQQQLPPPLPRPDVPDAPLDRALHYAIWLGGARVGTAVERETWTAGGVVLRRDETMRFLRGNASMVLATSIEVTASRALVASHVRWIERSSSVRLFDDPNRRRDAERDGETTRGSTGAPGDPARERRAEATRDATGGWRTNDGTSLSGELVPAELVPMLTRRDGTFSGRVFLPSRGFLAGDGRIERIAPSRLVARLALDGGAIAEATIDTGDDGTYTRVVDGEGVIAIRVSAAQAADPFRPVDLIAATSIPIAGVPGKALIVDGSFAIPSLPGQLVRPEADGTALELSPKFPGDLPYGAFGDDRQHEIELLVDRVRARIAPDLGAHPTRSRDAASATAGDCTTFALAYTALASSRTIPTRVVTGLRVDGGRLVRHRWAVSWTGRAWIAVDAAYGAAPAGGDLIGLAVHGPDDAGLVAGEAALAQVRSAAWR